MTPRLKAMLLAIPLLTIFPDAISCWGGSDRLSYCISTVMYLSTFTQFMCRWIIWRGLQAAGIWLSDHHDFMSDRPETRCGAQGVGGQPCGAVVLYRGWY